MLRNSVRGLIIAVVLTGPSAAGTDDDLQRIVNQSIEPLVPADGRGGVAVAVRLSGCTLFFNYGFADRATKAPMTSDALFPLASVRKVFEATLLAQAVLKGDLALDDRIDKYIPELRRGDDIRKVTLGQIATHTSGLLLRTDYPPWPEVSYTLSEFFDILNAWKAPSGVVPGKQHIYTHAGYLLLQLALERRYGRPIAELMDRSILTPLGMTSTVLPIPDDGRRGDILPALAKRAVQGYAEDGEAVGVPGGQDGYYDFPGSGQMFSSARDLAMLVAAFLGEIPIDETLRRAMSMTQQGVFRISPRNTQALAWEVNDYGGPIIVDKPGGLYNVSTYLGLVPANRLGIVILGNRGNLYPYEVARASLLPALAKLQ